MKAERVCAGLPADWLNAWLAAIGCVVRVPTLRLRWTDDPVPLAVLVAPGEVDPVELIAAAWPSIEEVVSLAIARHVEGQDELPLNPTVAQWRARVRCARSSPSNWTLSSLYTDLAWNQRARGQAVERGQLHTPMPGVDNTMHDRLRKLLAVPATTASIYASFDGAGPRVKNYGLGFDVSRIASLADKSEQYVDPVIEVLAFFGLALLPTRGDGVRRHQRCWVDGGTAMRWFSWRPALSAAGVDALLDQAMTKSWADGVNGSWASVGYRSRGTNDPTRGLGSGAR